MNDEELDALLKSWAAPSAPATLRERVFRRKSNPLRWLLSGEIRVPVPVALAALCLLLFIVYRTSRPASTSLSDFEQIDTFKPRIVRTVDETP